MEELYQLRKPSKTVRLVIEAIGFIFHIPSEVSLKHRVPSNSNYTPTITRLAEDYEGCLRILQAVDVTTLGNEAVSLLMNNVLQKEFDGRLAYQEGGEEVGKLCTYVQSLVQKILDAPGRKPVGKRKIMVAMDGSRMSYAAFEVANQLRGHSFVQVLHITDPTKEYLPPHLNPDYLATDFETRCVRKGIPNNSFGVSIRSRDEGQSTREALMQAVWNYKADILVLGSFGRKGPSIFQMGTTTDWSARCLPVTTVIANTNSVILDDTPIIGGVVPTPPPAVFLVAVDGSTLAQQACETALFLMKPQDKLLLLHIRIADGSQGHSEDITTYYEKRVENSMVNGRVVLEEKLGGKTISQQLCAAVEREGASFLVLGTDGMGAKMRNGDQLGSVSDQCSQRARCTIVLVKPPLVDEARHAQEKERNVGIGLGSNTALDSM